MTRSFGLDACSAFKALESTVGRFRADDLDQDLARDCAIKAWQLCDHVFIVLGSRSQFTTLPDLQHYARNACPELGFLQDICTESKHGKISRYAPRIVDARFRPGAFSGAFSRDFDISRLEIELPGGKTVWFSDVVDSALAFWAQFFQQYGIKCPPVSSVAPAASQ